MAVPVIAESDLVEVRNSPLHGLGVFATKAIKKGTRIIEYIGERVSHAEADRRYETKDDNDNHTFLFSVDPKVVIDAGNEGNDARYFNHSCAPNCESVIEDRRVFIESIKDIEPGEELTYDYQIGRDRGDPPNIDEIYACKCGAKDCRGTMMWPAKRPGRAKARAKAAAEKAANGAAKKSGSRAKSGAKSSARTQQRSAGARNKSAASQRGGKRAAGQKGSGRSKGAARAKSSAAAPGRASAKKAARGTGGARGRATAGTSRAAAKKGSAARKSARK